MSLLAHVEISCSLRDIWCILGERWLNHGLLRKCSSIYTILTGFGLEGITPPALLLVRAKGSADQDKGDWSKPWSGGTSKASNITPRAHQRSFVGDFKGCKPFQKAVTLGDERDVFSHLHITSFELPASKMNHVILQRSQPSHLALSCSIHVDLQWKRVFSPCDFKAFGRVTWTGLLFEIRFKFYCQSLLTKHKNFKGLYLCHFSNRRFPSSIMLPASKRNQRVLWRWPRNELLWVFYMIKNCTHFDQLMSNTSHCKKNLHLSYICLFIYFLLGWSSKDRAFDGGIRTQILCQQSWICEEIPQSGHGVSSGLCNHHAQYRSS